MVYALFSKMKPILDSRRKFPVPWTVVRTGILLCLCVLDLTLTRLLPDVTAQSVGESEPAAQVLSNPRVLVLHSYHHGFTWTEYPFNNSG